MGVNGGDNVKGWVLAEVRNAVFDASNCLC